MKIACVGGGPAGLTAGLTAKLDDPTRQVTVFERGTPDQSYGWGVVFGQRLLADLRRVDPVLGGRVAEAAFRWRDQLVTLGPSRVVHLGGFGYSIGRQRLLRLLAARAREVGVDVHFESPVGATDLGGADLDGADLVVVADGVHSGLGGRHAQRLGPSVTVGRNRYIWLGTPRLFDAFTFGFEHTGSGWIWFHGYRFDDSTSTFIAECEPSTWRALGFDQQTAAQSAVTLQAIFRRQLGDAPLLHRAPGAPAESASNRSAWASFPQLSHRSWTDGRLVLIGDAAHTAHFSIGSGTTLAMQDAVALVAALHAEPRIDVALNAYSRNRMPQVEATQQEARNSATWFEHAAEHLHGRPIDVGFSMSRRRFADQPPQTHRPAWRYAVHLATQNPALRAVRLGASVVAHTGRPALRTWQATRTG